MVSEWPTVKLGDVCIKIGSGATPRGGKSTYLESGPFTLVRSQNVLDNAFSWRGLAYISTSQAAALSGVELLVDDVLLNITGDSVARCCQVDRRALPGRVNQHVAIVRPDPQQLDPGYLRYHLTSPIVQQRMLALASAGATRNAITKAMIQAFEVALPPLGEQRRIASILGALDDKIELNRRMSQTLDEMTQAIFKSWFVDPVRDSWPSGGGELPDGWSVARLDDHIESTRGLSYSSANLVGPGEGLPLHNLNTVLESGGYKKSGLKWFAGEYKDRNTVVPGDLIVTNVEQGFEFLLIGFGALVPMAAGETSLYSADLFRVRPRAESTLTSTYLYMLLRDPQLHRVVAGYSNGTTVNHLSSDALAMPFFVVPPPERVAEYDRLAVPMLHRREDLEAEAETLADLRDVLLPRLLGGEIEVV